MQSCRPDDGLRAGAPSTVDNTCWRIAAGAPPLSWRSMRHRPIATSRPGPRRPLLRGFPPSNRLRRAASGVGRAISGWKLWSWSLFRPKSLRRATLILAGTLAVASVVLLGIFAYLSKTKRVNPKDGLTDVGIPPGASPWAARPTMASAPQTKSRPTE